MSATAMERGPGVVMHVRCPDRLPEETYREVPEQLWELSPVVQALPPAGALVDLRGALRYHGVTASHLGEILRLRTVSRYGVDARVGIGPTRSRQVRGFLRAQGGELAGHLTLRRRSSSRSGQQAFVRPVLGRV
jgi:hypothetical protein